MKPAPKIREGIEKLFTIYKEKLKELKDHEEIARQVEKIIMGKEAPTYELISRPQTIFELGRGAYRVEFKTSLALRRKVEGYAVVIDLTGAERIVRTGHVPAEQALWTVVLGIDSLKCNCPDNLFNTLRGLRGLRIIDKGLAHLADYHGLFDKYTLCKHTLYVLGLGIGFHGEKPYRRHVNALWLLLISIAANRAGRRMKDETRNFLKEYFKEIIKKYNLIQRAAG